MTHPINGDVAKLIADLGGGAPVDLTDPEVFDQFRNGFDEGVRLMRGPCDTSRFDVEVTDGLLEGAYPIPLRIYVPSGGSDSPTEIVYFHGGGWNMGTLETVDPELRWFAHRLGLKITSVDYRLAPEHPYPAALDDCMAVVRHLSELAPHLRLAVAGDSAGGNLAAAVAILCRDEGISLAGQLLINPALDVRMRGSSYDEFAEGYLLTRAGMEFNWSTYLQTVASRSDPLASPALSNDLVGLAPAVVVTAGYDPLRDDGVTYAQSLRGAGVQCVHLHLPGMAHGFLVTSGRVPSVTDAVEQFLYHFSAVISDDRLDS